MTYSWKKDYDNVQDSSGYGRSFMLFKNDYLENANNIGVTATTIDQKYSSSKNMSIGMAAPQISFYKKDTGMGILWENALLENHNLGGGETIVAVPYFISPKDIRRPDLLFRWFINNTLTPVPNFRKTILPLKAEAGAYGNATIRLEIENTDKIFQTSEREIRVEF